MSNPTSTCIQLHYVDDKGRRYDLQAAVGETLMHVATRNAVSGVGGDCGGNCACGTCLVRLDGERYPQTVAAGGEEVELLDFLGCAEPGFRLGCQVALTEDLEGILVTVASPD